MRGIYNVSVNGRLLLCFDTLHAAMRAAIELLPDHAQVDVGYDTYPFYKRMCSVNSDGRIVTNGSVASDFLNAHAACLPDWLDIEQKILATPSRILWWL